MLTVLSTLGPHRLDAGRYTVTSRFRCRSFDRRYVVGALSTGRCLPAVAPRVLIMGDEVRTRSFSPDNHFTLLQVTAPRITQKSFRPRVSDRIVVGTLANASACVASGPNGVERHCFMKPVSWDKQLRFGSPLEIAASQSGKIKSPSYKEAGLDVSHLSYARLRPF